MLDYKRWHYKARVGIRALEAPDPVMVRSDSHLHRTPLLWNCQPPFIPVYFELTFLPVGSGQASISCIWAGRNA